MRKTFVKEIMTKDVIAIRIDEPFSHVEEKIRMHRIRHLPVVNDKNEIVGIITQRDFYHVISPRHTEMGDYYEKTELDGYHLEHFMTKNPLTLSPEDSVAKVVKIMTTFKYGAIPIVDSNKKLVGIVTQIDILKFIAREMLPD